MINLSNINSLLELFIKKYEEQSDKNSILLSSLSKPLNDYSWEKTINSIYNLSEEINKYVNIGDRCLLISENRPEWFITDLAIMLTRAITVPSYTTYAERDYEYILDDCKPSVVFVSNQEQFIKIKNIVKNKSYIKKIFSFEKLENQESIKNIEDIFNNKK